MFYFQAMVEQQNHLFHLPYSSSYYDARPQSSHTVSQKRRFTNHCILAGYPETHASLVPPAQTKPTHSTPVEGSMSPSKLGLQAPH
jgi:hypothetical protein